MNIVPVTSEIADMEEGIEMGQTKSIAGDCKCFFKSLSHVISGTETNHRKIRLAVVKHMTELPCRFLSGLRQGYSFIEHYVTD